MLKKWRGMVYRREMAKWDYPRTYDKPRNRSLAYRLERRKRKQQRKKGRAK